jgi:hypothetical protein
MRRLVIAALAVALASVGAPAALADHGADEHSDNMSLVANWDDGGTYRMGSDLAFWQSLAVLGKYDGLTLMDIGNPAKPKHLGTLDCNGNQSDVTIWKDLVVVSVDSPMADDGCDAPPASAAQYLTDTHWEGLRIVDVADPRAPEQIATVKTDCGAHTHTQIPDLGHRGPDGQPDPRVLIYVSSYPLGGQGVSCNYASHRKISVVEIPLQRPTEAQVVSTPDVSPAMGCHDITVFLPRQLAAAACITESQIWDISDPVNPVIVSRIHNPAMQIHHSSAFSWDGDVLVLGDEMGGAAAAFGCNTGGSAPTGALWFYDVSDPTSPEQLSYYTIPQDEASALCTAHNFNPVPLSDGGRVLVSAWYNGGTHVIDFEDPTDPQQIAWYKPREDKRGAAWSSYWYNGAIFVNNFDESYVPSVPSSRGLDVFRVDDQRLRTKSLTFTHLNPQTQEGLGTKPPRNPGVDPEQREQAKERSGQEAQAEAQVPASLPFCLLQTGEPDAAALSGALEGL